ncbi:PD-(D/E)XK nuclease family protein [Candidatus Pacearchaeota archaeon]|nr:PD-(D/E)XK nuclease family protein [Candidatus Pacearchaeota archaeon]
MTIYSHSRLSTFEQCPLRFKYKYIDKIIPEIEKSIEAHLGNIVHDTLEWVYNSVKNEKKTPTLDEIITYYSIKWQDEFSEEILIVKKQLSEKDYFNKGVEFLINYYTKHQPFQDGTIECEKKILIKLNETGEYKLQGFIDRLVHNLKTGEYEVHDYKTASYLPTKEKIDKDRQLALYSIAIKELFGQDKEVILIWHYLAHNTKIISKRTNEQLTQLKKDTVELIKKIELTTEFPANKSILCNWCEYKNICPMFNKQEIPKENFTEIKKEPINTKEKKLDIWD